ncbi:MAG: hypothetical protein AAGA56_24625 [Myxococcota bacterium]
MVNRATPSAKPPEALRVTACAIVAREGRSWSLSRRPRWVCLAAAVVGHGCAGPPPAALSADRAPTTAPPPCAAGPGPALPVSAEVVSPLAEQPSSPPPLTVHVLGWRHASSDGNDDAEARERVQSCRRQLLSTSRALAATGASITVAEGLPAGPAPQSPQAAAQLPFEDLRRDLLGDSCTQIYGFESDDGTAHRELLAAALDMRRRRDRASLLRFQHQATWVSATLTRRSFQALERAISLAVVHGTRDVQLLIGAVHWLDLQSIMTLWAQQPRPPVELLRLRLYLCDAARLDLEKEGS